MEMLSLFKLLIEKANWGDMTDEQILQSLKMAFEVDQVIIKIIKFYT